MECGYRHSRHRGDEKKEAPAEFEVSMKRFASVVMKEIKDLQKTIDKLKRRLTAEVDLEQSTSEAQPAGTKRRKV